MYGVFLGTMIASFLVLGFFIFVFYLTAVIGLWKIFKKAGQNGWESLIPIYNIWILIQISGLNWWFFLPIIFGTMIPMIGPLVSLIAIFFCHYNISKKFKQDTGFAILLTLFPYIMYIILGFNSKYIYYKDEKVSKNGLFQDN